MYICFEILDEILDKIYKNYIYNKISLQNDKNKTVFLSNFNEL